MTMYDSYYFVSCATPVSRPEQATASRALSHAAASSFDLSLEDGNRPVPYRPRNEVLVMGS
jgi:hypothetical protein